MGYLFDEKKFINDNTNLLNTRLSSQYSRFLDSTPTYVTYYNVNNIESTVDYGFKNVEKVLGDTSPLRFNKIYNLPIYGLEQLRPDLSEEEEGITISLDSEAIILPNTVKPRPNDFFIVDYLGPEYIFMVTNIRLDTLRNDGYYSINFTLKHLNPEKLKDLERQTIDEFTCFIENIGTEEKVLIRKSDVEKLNKLNKATTEISKYYLTLFYDRKYNSLLLNQQDGTRLYDRLLTHFINKNKIFFNRSHYDTIYLTNEDNNRLLEMEYHHSIYRAIEQANPELIKPMFYGEGYANNLNSIFFHWRDNKIRSTLIGLGNKPYIRLEVIDLFRNAKEYYQYNKADEVEHKKILNVSIPVGDDEVFTQDAGYESKLSDTGKETSEDNTPTQEHRIIPYKEKTKLDLSDLQSVLSGNDEDEYFDEYINPEPQTIETPINNELEFNVTNLKDLKIIHDYKIPEGFDIVVKTITMYLSGNVPSLHSIEIEELMNYADYMKPNHETFILIPILLYVIEKYYKSYLKS